MIEPGENLALAQEPVGDRLRVEARPDPLEGDLLLELAVGALGEKDLAHPAFAETAHEAVGTDRLRPAVLVDPASALASSTGSSFATPDSSAEATKTGARARIGVPTSASSVRSAASSPRDEARELRVAARDLRESRRAHLRVLLDQLVEEDLPGLLAPTLRAPGGRSRRRRAVERRAQKRLRPPPVALQRALAALDDRRDLLERESGEETQLDQLGEIGAFALELAQGAIERQHLDRERATRIGETMRRLFELDRHHAAAALLGVAPAGEVDDDVAHDARRQVEEVRPVGRCRAGRPGEPEVGLVDERRGVEGPAGAAVNRELDVSEPLELRIDPLVERLRGLRARRRAPRRSGSSRRTRRTPGTPRPRRTPVRT